MPPLVGPKIHDMAVSLLGHFLARYPVKYFSDIPQRQLREYATPGRGGGGSLMMLVPMFVHKN